LALASAGIAIVRTTSSPWGPAGEEEGAAMTGAVSGFGGKRASRMAARGRTGVDLRSDRGSPVSAVPLGSPQR
jgi:hypothetical protein